VPAQEAYRSAKEGYAQFSERMGRESPVQEFLEARGDPAKQVSLLRDPSKGKAIKETLVAQFGDDAVREWNTVNAEGWLEPQLPGRPTFGQMTGMSQREAALARLEAMAEQSKMSVPAEARLGAFRAGQFMLLTRAPLRSAKIRKWMTKGLPEEKPAAKLSKITPPAIAPIPPRPEAAVARRAEPVPETPPAAQMGVPAPAVSAPPIRAVEPPRPTQPPPPPVRSRLEVTREESIRRTQIGQVASALEKGHLLKGGMAKVAQGIVEREIGMEKAKQMSDAELASALRAKLKPTQSAPPPAPKIGEKESRLSEMKPPPPEVAQADRGALRMELKKRVRQAKVEGKTEEAKMLESRLAESEPAVVPKPKKDWAEVERRQKAGQPITEAERAYLAGDESAYHAAKAKEEVKFKTKDNKVAMTTPEGGFRIAPDVEHARALKLDMGDKGGSVAKIQKSLKVGHGRAKSIFDQLTKEGKK
jgi:hypothetical protein